VSEDAKLLLFMSCSNTGYRGESFNDVALPVLKGLRETVTCFCEEQWENAPTQDTMDKAKRAVDRLNQVIAQKED
jgi:hypothetical protein